MAALIKKKSNIHGFGIFTGESINKNSIFYMIPLEKILDKPEKGCAPIGKGKYVYDGKVLNWVNHSCNPSCLLNIKNSPPFLVALKNIKPGEEITCDYNITDKGGKRIKCACKSNKCWGYFLRIE